MISAGDIASWLQAIHERATAGYAVALHLGLHSPLYLFQTYPAEWNAVYAGEGLLLSDPTALWGLARTGRATWADLAAMDRAGVHRRAAEHGLRHGLSVSVNRDGSRSIASFARGDRPFDLAEEEALEAAVTALHRASAPGGDLGAAEREVLRRLSVAFTRPLT